MAAFSTNVDGLINRSVETTAQQATTSLEQLETLYELEGCCTWIKENKFSNVNIICLILIILSYIFRELSIN